MPPKIPIKSNLKKKGSYTFIGDDHIFCIESKISFQSDSEFLYIRKGYKLETDSVLFQLISSKIIIKVGTQSIDIVISRDLGNTENIIFDKYRFHRPLIDERKYDYSGEIPKLLEDDDENVNENDCLKFGECMTFVNQKKNSRKMDEMLKAFNSPAVLQTTNGNAFGATENDEDNIKAIKKIPNLQKNDAAVPQAGESYAIVRRKVIENASPYHISFVIHQYNNVNITLEANADRGNHFYPKFCMYDTNPEGRTFHKLLSGKYLENYTTDEEKEIYLSYYYNADTIVLQSRNLEQVEKEMELEMKENIDKSKHTKSVENDSSTNKKRKKNDDELDDISHRKTTSKIVGGKSHKRTRKNIKPKPKIKKMQKK
jgi:hypothetical protein